MIIKTSTLENGENGSKLEKCQKNAYINFLFRYIFVKNFMSLGSLFSDVRIIKQ